MKKYSNYFLMTFAVLALGFLASCGDDEEVTANGPSITIGGEDGDENSFEGHPGDEINLTITVNSEIGFNRLQINKVVGEDGPVSILDTARAAGDPVNAFVTDFDYILQSNEVGENVVLNFIATDDDGNSNTASYTVSTLEQPAVRYSAVILAAPLGSTPGQRSSDSFFSSETGLTYTADEVVNGEELSALIDFGYYYLSEAGTANLASPANFPEAVYNLGPNGQQWGTLNNTKLRKTNITAQQYIEYTEENTDAIFAAFEDATPGTNEERALDINQFDVLAFETDAAQGEDVRRGLILIEELVPGDGVEGQIEIEVLVTQ